MRMFTVVRAAIRVACLVVGTPLLLLMVGGSPVPDRLPSLEQVQQWANAPLQMRYAGPTVRLFAWLVWLVVLGVTVSAVTARLRRWRWSRLTVYLPGPVQGLAAAVLGAASVASATSAAAAPAAAAGVDAALRAGGDPVDQHHASPDDAVSVPSTTGAERDASTVVSDRQMTLVTADLGDYTVQRGDSLSAIADECLGDAGRWPEIFDLNRGKRFPGVGGTLRHPDLIYPGWTLQLPEQRSDSRDTPTNRPGTGTPPSPPPDAAGTPADGTASATPSPTDGGSIPTPPPTAEQADDNAEADDPGGDAADQRQPSGRRGVELLSGSWIDTGLAAAILTAAGLVWAHRRRRYTPRPLHAQRRPDGPDLAPMPPIVAQLRRRLRQHMTAGGAAAGEATPNQTTLNPPGTDPADWHTGEHEPDVGVPAEPSTGDDGNTRPAPTAGATPDARPVVPTSTNPAAVWPSCGLGLTGPGAEPAARGFLAAALADTDPDSPPGQVVIPSTTAATLLGTAAATLPTTPRLVVTDDLDDALSQLEQQILQRSRLVYVHEVDTVAALRTTDAWEEPAPPLLLIADTTSNHERTRITALLAQGQRLDVHGILLGDWPAGDTVTVEIDGTTTTTDSARHSHHPADVGRLAVLTPTETAAVLTTLAEAHTGLPQPTPPAEPQPHRHAEPEPAASDTALVLPLDDAGRILTALADLDDATAAAIAAHLDLPYPATTANLVHWEHTGHAETIRTDTGQTLWRLTPKGRTAISPPNTDTRTPAPSDAAADTGQPAPVTPPGAGAGPGDRFAEIGTVLRWPDPTTAFTSEHRRPPEPGPDSSTEKPGHVEVTVLGEAAIVATDPDRRPRRKALELLVYLAVNDGSATVEAILDDLLPDSPASKAPERLHTYVSDLRAVMRRTGGPATYLTHPHRRYTLNPDTVDIDLWRMRAAIREAHHATNPHRRIAALRQAVDAYRGPLADGADYEWAEPYREAIRQQALDVHIELADALADDPAAQARILEAAIGHSPYSEQLYQRAMRARAKLGHLDAIRTLRRALDRALAEIDAEAGDDTITLANQLIADLQRPRYHADVETARCSN